MEHQKVKVSLPATEAEMQQIQIKTFTFPQLTAGDCVMENGSNIILYSDGKAIFDATVWTNHTHSGDTWEHIIEFQDFRGLSVFSTFKMIGPNHMNDDGTHYHFGPVLINFDPKLFDSIQKAVPYGFC